jgi:hypothetical protein
MCKCVTHCDYEPDLVIEITASEYLSSAKMKAFRKKMRHTLTLHANAHETKSDHSGLNQRINYFIRRIEDLQ